MYTFTKEKHKNEFKQYTNQLVKQEMEVIERNACCNELITEYINYTGEKPPESCLERLANFILKDHLSCTHPDKLTNEVNPILSNRQQQTRNNKEFTKEAAVLDFIKLKIENKAPHLSKKRIITEHKGD